MINLENMSYNDKLLFTVFFSFMSFLFGYYHGDALAKTPEIMEAYEERFGSEEKIEKPLELWQTLNLSGVEKDICITFGKDCQMALAVSQAENGTRQCDRIIVEPNATTSIGIFMINQVHYKRFTAAALVTCQGNIEAAKVIYDNCKLKNGVTVCEPNWGPWSTYKNGSYKKFLN